MEQVIFIDENIPLLAKALNTCGEVFKFSGRNLTGKMLIDSDCNILFTRSTTRIDSGLLKGTNVKFIGTATSGTDHADIEFLKRNNITFAYAPGSNANSVAEYVVYSILKWRDLSKFDLMNKTIGIIGFGNIGKIVAKYSNYLGLKILVNDPPLKDMDFRFPDFIEYSGLDFLCKNADIITNHVPLTYEGIYSTYYLFNGQNIRLFKPDSLFIHTSRGGVVDEESLLLKQIKDKIYLVIDVWENEPDINQNLLGKAIVATPHIAGYSREGKVRGVKMMADAFKDFSGLEPDYSEINIELSHYNPLYHGLYKDYDILFNYLQASRQLDSDTMKLKSIFLQNKNSSADLFDKFRKTYPARREIL